VLQSQDPNVKAYLQFLLAKPVKDDDGSWREGHMPAYTALKQKFPAHAHSKDKANQEIPRLSMYFASVDRMWTGCTTMYED
jgi:hypothetical protein